MKERGILFSASMVRALIDGRKTQTRRACKPGARIDAAFFDGLHSSPYGKAGDRLWVRETFWHQPAERDGTLGLIAPEVTLYRADVGTKLKDVGYYPWKPSIFMPRRLSRITLELTEVRVERLQEISEADAIAEGIQYSDRWEGFASDDEGRHFHCTDPRVSYLSLWESINGAGSWDANPWVWALSFRRPS